MNKLFGKLHKGELEVIVGAKELNVDFAVIDEIAARNLSKIIGILNIEFTPKSQKIKNATKIPRHKNPQNKEYQ